jgi:hypothetical protein
MRGCQRQSKNDRWSAGGDSAGHRTTVNITAVITEGLRGGLGHPTDHVVGLGRRGMSAIADWTVWNHYDATTGTDLLPSNLAEGQRMLQTPAVNP